MILKRIFLLSVLYVPLKCEVYQDRPKIKTSDGDLILEPGLDKNIYLRPNGPKSSIFIGSMDMLKTNISTETIQSQTMSSDNLNNYLNGPSGILQRLEKLESKASAFQNFVSTIPNITALSRKVRSLNRKVIALQNQINTRPKSECDSHPCQHGGTCLNFIDGYHCLCPSNWEGRDCDVDVNECRNFAGTDLGCQNGATCVNKPGTYECFCRSGWYGLHCTRKAKDCFGGDFEMCGHGTCISITSGEGIKCICHQGWTSNATSGTCLTDINECESNQGPRCSVNPKVECINLPGSFRCGQCPVGYEGDGYICNDVDECTTIPNGGCSPMVACHNTIGSRICGSCPPGYLGDGVTCVFRVSCSIDNGGCHPLAQCVESRLTTSQAALCTCPEGMIGDGVGLLGCFMSTGDCESNPCGSHGRCHLLRSGYTCICDKGYGGTHCNSSKDACTDKPCQNGGTCREDDTTTSGFRCECMAQYSGRLCQVRSTSCGGVLNAEEGTIAYPLSNTSSTYSHNAQCGWIIHTSSDKVIQVTFTKFNLELSSDCSSDFLQIHDGQESSDQLLGKFCGNALPKGGNITSSHNYLYLWFHSDGTIAKSGFVLHWTSVKPICGGEIVATTHGQISSPGSPGPYPPNRDCYWHLITTLGKRIGLYFFALDIEAHDNCSYDYVAVYDGIHVTDPLLSKYCNSTQPAPVQSASSHLLIHFHSDAYGSGKGFQIVYAPTEGIPGCGGYFTADKGEIFSPAYNGKYLNNLLCEYKIKTTPETKIKIDFEIFTLEITFGCRYDFLKIYDGASSDSRLVGTFCGSRIPSSYTSSSNSLYLIFKTDRSKGAEGFKITYESICEKYLLGDSGVIKSIAYPFSSSVQITCTYIISTDPGKAIQLAFQDFDIVDNRGANCKYDHVEIRDGPDKNSTLLGRYCGSVRDIPPIITSTHNYMYLRFQCNSITALKSTTRYYANYTTIDTTCGGIYRERAGLINYPPEENTFYQNNQSCQWLILAPEGMIIKITWIRFDIENRPDCQGDYLQLIEIKNNNENDVLGKYCGSRSPPTLTTTTNRLKLKFISDKNGRYPGFSMSYRFSNEETHCGGNYINSHGSIYVPGWSYSSRLRRNCMWIITAPVGQQISLNISNFELHRLTSGHCSPNAYLEIRNGGSSTSPLLGIYCDKFASKLIKSLGNMLYIHSTLSYFDKGFKIEWDGTITGCGGTLTSPTGSITSPNYPNEYHENAECFYRIATSAASRIHISFEKLDLEQSINCHDDYIEIFNGRDTNAPSLGKQCLKSTKLPTFETSTNYAYIKFRSDSYGSGIGFVLNYYTICNNNLTGPYGVVESPGYPNNYPTRLKCLWNIQVPKGNKINVTFTHFDILQQNEVSYSMYLVPYPKREIDCYQHFLQIKEIQDLNTPKKLCGYSLPKDISSRSNSLEIYFFSGTLYSRTGFRLEWISYGCGGHILKDTGIISFDSSFTTEKEIECEWLIESSSGNSITIDFTAIYMFVSTNCTMDVIEVYNGRNTEAPLLSKICFPKEIIVSSESNFMLVRFVKRSTLNGVHFSSNYLSSISQCGGFINTMSGFFYSKNYPNNYENNLNCDWYISVPKKHRIEINFVDLDLYSDDYKSDSNVCGDSILIYETNILEPSSNYTYRICPNTNKTQFVTKQNHVKIQFKTDSLGTAKGFKANFTLTCGAVISAHRDGIITNNNFISTSNKSCIWTIIAPALDQKISLTITHMSLPKNTDVITNRNCPSAFLRVLDGNDENAPLIGEYCGSKVPAMIVSHGNALTVQQGSYTDRSYGTFSIHYSPITNSCGGTITSEEGTIASPSYPSPYPLDVDCEWVIKTSPGNNAYLTFERFDLEYSEDCNEDYLEIRDHDNGGNLLGLYCGSDIPSNFTKSVSIFIKFHSNSRTSGQGFLLHYGYLHENYLDNDNGVISSPLYPNRYEGPGQFIWHISTTGVDGIALSIFFLEIPSRGDVIYNKLTIYDGYDNTANIVDQLHGAVTLKKTIQLTSNVGLLILTMDNSNTGSLFYLNWTAIPRNIQINTDKCGSNHTELILPGQISVLKSPKYPDNYENNLNCEWVYKTLIGRHLSVRFTELSLEQVGTCLADSISIYSADLLDDWKPVKESICKFEEVNDKIESSIYMKINFKTDTVIGNRGFLAHVSSKCGGFITELSGEFGPIWLDSLTPDSKTTFNCDWMVRVRPGRMIRLEFSHFNITNSNACLTYVLLRNGDTMEAPLLASGKYCGYEQERKKDIITSSNSLFVSYKGETFGHSFVFQSFKIYYEEVNYECGSTSELTLDHTWEIISSPNYPSIPVPYSECIWMFSGPPGEILRIDFINRFDLDETDNCGTEVVEIRDGSSSLSPVKARLCGEKPTSIKSSSNTMYVKYNTQLAVPRNGFEAKISIDVCGGTLISDNGEITSPGYPHMQVFPPGTICVWNIIGSQEHVFLIKPDDVNLPHSQAKCGTKIYIDDSMIGNETITNSKTICNDDDEDSTAAVETLSNRVTITLTIGKPNQRDQISEFRGFQIKFSSSRVSCIFRLSTSEGYLMTPNYPKPTTVTSCFWSIEVPDKSRRIRLELLDADQRKHSISIFNDFDFRTIIQRLTGDQSISENKMFESVGNKLAIIVSLNHLGSSHRFKARFSSDVPALCGGYLTGLSQELFTPELQQPYSCEWHYDNQVSIENQKNLTYNSIFITASVKSSVNQAICPSNESKITLKSSIGNAGFIFYREICSNTEVSYRLPSSIIDISSVKVRNHSFDFHFYLKSQPCGGSFYVEEEPINIINIPDYFNETLDCAWIILSSLNNRVEIKMTGAFFLECEDEYITIMQGLNQYDPIIGKYCKGQYMENTLVTHFPYMYIQYHSNIKSKTDIKLIAKTVTNQCGGLLTYHNGFTFSSPNYPKAHTPNQECVWYIQANTGFRVSLKFIERFAIESKPNCTKDVVIIYDWKNDDYKEMARVCGRRTPPSYNSTYNRMKVVFRTDEDTNLDGFKAQWTPICGGKYEVTEKKQILYSPGFPEAYEPLMHCSYEFTAPNKQIIVLKFLEFDLEGDYPDCFSDNLTVTAQSYNYIYQVLCGSKMPTTIRSYDRINLEFKTDRVQQRKGFKISFFIFKCGGVVNDVIVPIVISPTLGNYDYGETMNCTWIIEAPVNKIVVVKFINIDLESQPECFNDHVALYDGGYMSANKRLALLCGFINSTTVLKSTEKKMVLQFIKNSRSDYQGFKALISFSYSAAAGCGGVINLSANTPAILKSPLMSNSSNYDNFLECYWLVTSPPDTVIQITFTKFHVAPCKNINLTATDFSKCECDSVEIKDGFNPNSLVIGTYCGDISPPQLITSQNKMSVRLSTDGELQSSGFTATLTVKQTICGRTVIPVSFTPYRFKSPGYDTGSIPRGLHCLYHLDTNNDQYVQTRISIINLQLRSSSTVSADVNICNKDRLIISSISLISNNTVGKDLVVNYADDFFSHIYFYDITMHFPTRFELCGHKKSVDYYVMGSASINLITSPEDDNEVHKGVEIEVATLAFCGRNYTEEQGRIKVAYAYNTKNDDVKPDCYTLITAPENHTISMYFIEAVSSYGDPQTYLEFFDGDKPSARLLRKIQGELSNNYPIFSTGRYVLLHNHQNSYYRVTFDLNYITTDKGKGCGGKLSNIVGAVTSPLYPNTYRHNSECEWELETPVGSNLLIRFETFELGRLCDENYLEFVDSKGIVVRTFCSEAPADYKSNDNYVKLVFHTSMNNAGKGWSAMFVGLRV